MESINPEILNYYNRGREVGRLAEGAGALEWTRVCEIVSRYLPAAPGVILDVGGGPGRHACWLAAKGHAVHLVEPVPLHVEQAREAAAAQPDHPLAAAEVGDARRLPYPDEFADLVLMFGPLYHLPERTDRLTALREAHRVLRPGGRLLAIAISRFASALDGLRQGFLDDPTFAAIVEEDLKTGRHSNPEARPGYFTTAYFHRPEELQDEVQEAGFRWETTLGVQGPAWLLSGLEERWADGARREGLLHLLRRLEAEPSLLGINSHFLAVGRRPER